MRRVDVLLADLVDLVEDFQQVGFRVDANPFDAGEDFGNDLLRGVASGLLRMALRWGITLVLTNSSSLPWPARSGRDGCWSRFWGPWGRWGEPSHPSGKGCSIECV